MQDKKVLVVDDDIPILKAISRSLSSNGFEVITAENGSKAFTKAYHEKPDVIVTDLGMPVMDGLGLVENVQSSEETWDIPVILITGKIPKDGALRGKHAIKAALAKPFSPKHLLGAIQTILEQQQSGLHHVPTSTCITEEDIQRLTSGGMEREEILTLMEQLRVCASCRDVFLKHLAKAE